MSAVPKKKLCWNCEGNVARQIDNCPYCGVYLHGTEPEETNDWNPSYTPKNEKEPFPHITSPFYSANSTKANEKVAIEDNEIVEESPKKHSLHKPTHTILTTQLKKDFFPIFFLMAGSIFFLFGLVLFLFSTNGTFTLKWNGDNWIYFLGLSVPLLLAGWRFLEQIHEKD